MGIDACIRVTKNRPIPDTILEMYNWAIGRDMLGVTIVRAEEYDDQEGWVPSDNELEIEPRDLGRMYRPGVHLGSWPTHRKLIMWLLDGVGTTSIITYYGDSGNVEPVVMSKEKVAEYDVLYAKDSADLLNRTGRYANPDF